MTDKQAFDKLIEHASPHIRLTHVVDEEGNLLFGFHLHPQMNEDCFMTLDKITNYRHEIMLTTTDVRDFGKKVIEFADLADHIVEKYQKL